MNDTDIVARLTLPAGHDFEPVTARSMQPTGWIGWDRRCRRCGEKWRWNTYVERWELERKGDSRCGVNPTLPDCWRRVRRGEREKDRL